MILGTRTIAAAVVAAAAVAGAAEKPHILMILSDDFGWADVGYHNTAPVGGVPADAKLANVTKFATPVMDGLVGEGVELNHHYAFKFCSPTRCALQSGRNPIHVNVMNLDPAGGPAAALVLPG